MVGWVYRSCSGFSLPNDTKPVPIGLVYSAFTRQGTITFDRDLDTSVAIVPETMKMSQGGILRSVVSATYSGTDAIDFTANTIGSTPPPAGGFYYSAAPNWMRGVDTARVDAFGPFP